MRTLLKRIGVTAAGTLVAASVLTGCSSGDANGSDSDGILSSVETMFGTVEVPEPDGDLRVVAMGWSDAETALALGVTPIGVKDWGDFGTENKGVGPWATSLFGDETPEVIPNSADITGDFEQIAAMAPDLILSVSSANSEDDFRRLSGIAPTIYAPAGTPAFAPGWRVQTEVIAQALGLEDKGEELIRDVDTQFSDARTDHPEFDSLDVVTGLKFGEAYGVSLPGDVRHDFLTDLGFSTDPALEKLDNAQGFFAPVSVENVDIMDSDVAVIFPIGFTADDIRRDRFISGLPVVREGRAVILDSTGELSQAFTASSVLSVPIILKEMLPMLSDAAAAAVAAQDA